ncbi:hypothetical protein AGABI2DRAFT_193945 [Agaricus bisporus var. bisporus H97]|uniref:hypothetical protein n=1 Tax=Agaricus bisporus var. bisporus (strain H97 / ATCC MYA-4626 / FGSC 10389) TaxID=936046 RepID=UPI00029F6EDF|nr:hypothetical protein AGABI2DRAFT_193945 [Agaricus bisporus var. bisporus H97]EKV46047.1 hypothetical protein AGABI2DRAFT_193945 [Agaricus bisporus var. bisporus H97]
MEKAMMLPMCMFVMIGLELWLWEGMMMVRKVKLHYLYLFELVEGVGEKEVGREGCMLIRMRSRMVQVLLRCLLELILGRVVVVYSIKGFLGEVCLRLRHRLLRL